MSVPWWWSCARAGSAAVQADAAGLHSGKDSSAAVTPDAAGGNVPPWQLIHEAAMAFITGALEQVEELFMPCQFRASSFRESTRRRSHFQETHAVCMWTLVRVDSVLNATRKHENEAVRGRKACCWSVQPVNCYNETVVLYKSSQFKVCYIPTQTTSAKKSHCVSGAQGLNKITNDK